VVTLPFAHIRLEHIAFTDAFASIELDQMLFRLLIKIHGKGGIKRREKKSTTVRKTRLYSNKKIFETPH
jgi:hypothetical protein